MRNVYHREQERPRGQSNGKRGYVHAPGHEQRVVRLRARARHNLPLAEPATVRLTVIQGPVEPLAREWADVRHRSAPEIQFLLFAAEDCPAQPSEARP